MRANYTRFNFVQLYYFVVNVCGQMAFFFLEQGKKLHIRVSGVGMGT